MADICRIDGAEGRKIELHLYRTETAPAKGAVLLLHGMAEHFERYEGFLKELNKNGYDAYIYSHRGHGRETAIEDLGFFAKKKGWDLVIEDAVAALKYVKRENRGAKTLLFGHSMGSLISRNVIQRFDDIDAAIICGTAVQPDIVCVAGIAVASVITFFCGAKHKSPLMDAMAFGGSGYKKLCKRTKCDWLTKDEKIVDTYIEDPYCGFLCTASFYRDLVTITGKAKWGMGKTRKDLPIFLASGEDDPVGGLGKGVKKLYKKYKELGFTGVSMKLYATDRHELLNELDKDKVTEDFISFYDGI